METTEQVLKRDAAGRVWTPRAQRAAAVDAFEQSGLPATKFAAEIGVKYQTFANWVQKRRQERAAICGQVPAVAPGSGWVEATVASAATRGLLVHLPGGARLEVTHFDQVALAVELLRALGEGGARC